MSSTYRFSRMKAFNTNIISLIWFHQQREMRNVITRGNAVRKLKWRPTTGNLTKMKTYYLIYWFGYNARKHNMKKFDVACMHNVFFHSQLLDDSLEFVPLNIKAQLYVLHNHLGHFTKSIWCNDLLLIELWKKCQHHFYDGNGKIDGKYDVAVMMYMTAKAP